MSPIANRATSPAPSAHPNLTPTVLELHPGEWAEIKCQVDSAGKWLAERITIAGLKHSRKIKGTVTRVIGDPGRPDAVEIEGLRVALREGTDIVLLENRVAEDLFRDLKSEDLVGTSRGPRRLAPGVLMSGSLRSDFRREDAFTLRDGDRRDITEPSLRLELLARPWGKAKLFGQLRMKGSYGFNERGSLDATGALSSSVAGIDGFRDDSQIQIRQLYLSLRDIGGRSWGLVLGKQRMKDSREFLFDEYLDAARLYVYGMRPLVLEASFIAPVVPLKSKLDTWHDLLLQARVYPARGWKAKVYTLRREDSDARQRDVRYYGVGLHGRGRVLKVWLDAALLRGHDKGLSQRAQAYDLGASLRVKRWPGRPSLSFGYAVGSGDEDPSDTVSNRFRQSGYDDNSSRQWGIANFQHYGEVLDPELVNLRVTTVGVGARPLKDLSVDLVYHRYRQDRLTTRFSSSRLLLVDKPLRGDVDDLGRAVDLVLGWRNLLGRSNLAYKLGVFDPGAAFGSADQQVVVQKLEMRLDF